MPAHSVQLIPFTERESVKHLAEMDQFLDLIIPRGGAGLIEAVVSMARMPVINAIRNAIAQAWLTVRTGTE